VVGNKQEKMISLGIGIYLAYVAWIGGDFMTGRFLSVPLLSAVLVLVRLLSRRSFVQKTFLLAVLIILGLITDRPSFNPAPAQDIEFETFTGVGDEQAAYYSTTGLLRQGRLINFPDHQWYYDGLALRDQGVNVYEGKGIGFLGFAAGPNVHVIDIFALSDPLLSHLPVQSKTEILIGHFRRSIPDGYMETLETGRNEIQDPDVAEYYEKLSLITRGKIWSFERWKAIWKLNTGQYNDLLAP
jgi:arabinofuranosyltransferase